MLTVLTVLVVLQFLAIGHQHNQVATLTRRVNANAIGLQTLANRQPGPSLGDMVGRIGTKVLTADAGRRAN